MNTLCLVLSHNYVITINQYLNQCLHLVSFACILSDEKARTTFYKKVAMCSDGGEWRDNFHFSSNNLYYAKTSIFLLRKCNFGLLAVHQHYLASTTITSRSASPAEQTEQ